MMTECIINFGENPIGSCGKCQYRKKSKLVYISVIINQASLLGDAGDAIDGGVP